jgi:hypothetical protein
VTPVLTKAIVPPVAGVSGRNTNTILILFLHHNDSFNVTFEIANAKFYPKINLSSALSTCLAFL